MVMKYWYTKKQRNNKPIVVKISLLFVAGWAGTAIFSMGDPLYEKNTSTEVINMAFLSYNCQNEIPGGYMIPSFSKKKKKKIQRRKSAMQRPHYLTNHVNKFTKESELHFPYSA